MQKFTLEQKANFAGFLSMWFNRLFLFFVGVMMICLIVFFIFLSPATVIAPVLCFLISLIFLSFSEHFEKLEISMRMQAFSKEEESAFWEEEIKKRKIYEVCLVKFEQHPKIKEKLLLLVSNSLRENCEI